MPEALALSNGTLVVNCRDPETPKSARRSNSTSRTVRPFFSPFRPCFEPLKSIFAFHTVRVTSRQAVLRSCPTPCDSRIADARGASSGEGEDIDAASDALEGVDDSLGIGGNQSRPTRGWATRTILPRTINFSAPYVDRHFICSSKAVRTSVTADGNLDSAAKPRRRATCGCKPCRRQKLWLSQCLSPSRLRLLMAIVINASSSSV